MTTSADIVPYGSPHTMVSWPAHRLRRQALDHAGSAHQRIVGSKSTQLPSVATKIPDGTKPESGLNARPMARQRAYLGGGVLFPYVDLLLTQLALETLVVVMDGSVVGRGCLALMLHVVYKGRALPLAWRVRHSPKGHCPEDLHIAMVVLLRTLIPEGAK